MSNMLTLDRWGDVVSTRLLVGGGDGSAGGTDEAVTGLLGSDVDQTLPIDLVGHEYGVTGYSSKQVARWQPMARAEDGRALWRASHGMSWHASDGAPRPPPEIAPKALRVKAARDPAIPGEGLCTHHVQHAYTYARPARTRVGRSSMPRPHRAGVHSAVYGLTHRARDGGARQRHRARARASAGGVRPQPGRRRRRRQHGAREARGGGGGL